MWQRNWTIFKKIFWLATAPTFIEPFIYLLSLGIGLGLFVREIEGLSYIQFLAPGLLASTAMFGSSFETTYDSYVRMRYERTYDAVLATPLSIEDVIGGEILWGTTRGYLNALVFLAVITVFGLVESPAALLLIPLLLIFSLLFAVIGMIFTALVANIALFNYYFTLFITPLFLFSGIFFPVDALPIWAQRLAWFTPLYHVVVVCRGLVLGRLSLDILISTVWVSAIALTLFLVPIVLMRRRLIK
ncbi:MAG: ABC transporter permease [Actinobacteria bacterium]|nr:ABC transporter permease [Actinomycetota bacterium]